MHCPTNFWSEWISHDVYNMSSRSMYSSGTEMGASSLSVSMTDEFKTIQTKPEGSEVSQVESMYDASSLQANDSLICNQLQSPVKFTKNSSQQKTCSKKYVRFCYADINATCLES